MPCARKSTLHFDKCLADNLALALGVFHARKLRKEELFGADSLHPHLEIVLEQILDLLALVLAE